MLVEEMNLSISERFVSWLVRWRRPRGSLVQNDAVAVEVVLVQWVVRTRYHQKSTKSDVIRFFHFLETKMTTMHVCTCDQIFSKQKHRMNRDDWGSGRIL